MSKMRREVTKIRYGGTMENPLLWKCDVIHAKEKVVINGTLKDALMGMPGMTVGCHLSYCAMNKRNQEVWSHGVPIFASFTKSMAFMIIEFYDQRKKERTGRDGLAVKYRHSHGDLVDINDTDLTKKFIKENPEFAERTFTLRPPNPRKVEQPKGRPKGRTTGIRRSNVPIGALRRARKAGLIDEAIFNILDKEVNTR